MVLYCVSKKTEEIEEDVYIRPFTDQRDAYNYKKSLDPDNTKDLMIYPVEV